MKIVVARCTLVGGCIIGCSIVSTVEKLLKRVFFFLILRVVVEFVVSEYVLVCRLTVSISISFIFKYLVSEIAGHAALIHINKNVHHNTPSRITTHHHHPHNMDHASQHIHHHPHNTFSRTCLRFTRVRSRLADRPRSMPPDHPPPEPPKKFGSDASPGF